jgi:hypothetical protein
MSQHTHNYIQYGTPCNAEEVIQFLAHTLNVNTKAEATGRLKTPLCIWGTHGIGKTQIVEHYAKQNGYAFRYIAPAQFEEMGDLIGMPKIKEAHNTEVTAFVPPEWVPTENGPGILLIDDVNRADDRILRGIMQLLQNYELASWKMPPQWHIVLTANPDGGDYSVTPMDFAFVTRMMHITLKFDVKQWALWAEKNEVDARGINFVLTYPEIVSGERTTPRTLVQFCEHIQPISDLAKQISLVKMLADACLDSATVTAFLAFVNNQLNQLLSPEQILYSKNFDKEVLEHLQTLTNQDTQRVDILSTITTRLVNHLLLNEQKKIATTALENLKKYLKMSFLPNDMRFLAVRDLVNSNNSAVQNIATDPELSKVLLSGAI